MHFMYIYFSIIFFCGSNLYTKNFKNFKNFKNTYFRKLLQNQFYCERLLIKWLLVQFINWYVNTLVNFHCEFYKTSVNGYFLVHSLIFKKLPWTTAFFKYIYSYWRVGSRHVEHLCTTFTSNARLKLVENQANAKQ